MSTTGLKLMNLSICDLDQNILNLINIQKCSTDSRLSSVIIIDPTNNNNCYTHRHINRTLV